MITKAGNGGRKNSAGGRGTERRRKMERVKEAKVAGMFRKARPIRRLYEEIDRRHPVRTFLRARLFYGRCFLSFRNNPLYINIFFSRIQLFGLFSFYTVLER